MKRHTGLKLAPRGYATWEDWMDSKRKKHVHTFRDDVILLFVDVLKLIYYLHGLEKALFAYTDKELYIEFFMRDGNYCGSIPFDTIDKKCVDLKEDVDPLEKERLKEKIKRLLVQSFSSR